MSNTTPARPPGPPPKLSSLFPGGWTAIDTFFARSLHKLTGPEVKLYVCLAEHRKRGRLTAWPSYETIRRETGMGKSTISQARKGLIAKQWIIVDDRKKNRVSLYFLVPRKPSGSPMEPLAVLNQYHQRRGTGGSKMELLHGPKRESSGPTRNFWRSSYGTGYRYREQENRTRTGGCGCGWKRAATAAGEKAKEPPRVFRRA